MPSGNSNISFKELKFERIENASILSNFFCGIDIMDNFIHNNLQEYINKNKDLKTYMASCQDETVAMFSLIPDKLVLDDDDKDDMRTGYVMKPKIALEDSEYLNSNTFDAIEIAYLAVSKSYRKKGIGSFIVDEIIKKIKKDCPNCQFLTVEAYKSKEYSATGFYEKCGFMQAELPNPSNDVLRMYRVLFPIH